MKNQRKRWGKGLNPKNPQSKQQKNKQRKRKRERSGIYRLIMKKKKQREEKKSVPSKYVVQTENDNRSKVGVVAQMNKKKEGESSETKIIGQMGK